MDKNYIFDTIEYMAQSAPDHTAIIFKDERIRYSTFYSNILKYACWLVENGIKKDDLIFYQLKNTPEFFYLFYASSLIGSKLVGVNIKSPLSETMRIMNSLSPKLFVIDDNLYDLGRYNLSEFKIVPSRKINRELNECKNNIDKVYSCQSKVSPEDVVIIIFTSGTTGLPKGAMLTHKSILSAAKSQLKEFGAPVSLTQDDIVQNYYPVNHVSGAVQWGAVLFSLGCTVMLLDTFNPLIVLKNTEKYQLRTLTGVPAMWKMYFDVMNVDKNYNLSSVTWCGTGAAPTNSNLLEKIFDVCDNVTNPLGMTETSGFCTGFFGKNNNFDNVLSTVGQVSPHLTYKIIKDNSSTDEVGKLAFKGDAVVKGYLNSNLPKTVDGYYITNDLAWTDKNGLIHLCGRSDDAFMVGGFNVYPVEIENIITTNFDVEEAVIVPIPHRTMGNVCRAYISSNKQVDTKKIIRFLEENIVSYKIPYDIKINCELPRNAMGKILRSKIKESIKEEFNE